MKSTELTDQHWLRVVRSLRRFTGRGGRARQGSDPQPQFTKALAGLLWHDQVLGYSIAEKSTDGMGTRQVCVRFYVNRKVSKSRLKSPWRVPSELQLCVPGKKKIEQVKVATDIFELRGIPVAQRLVSPGDSIGHKVGTMGRVGLVVDGNSSGRFLLTCSHVAAPPVAVVGDAIESPADPDGAAGPNTIGRLFFGTRFRAGASFDMDAALVELDPTKNVTVSNGRLALGPLPTIATITPSNQLTFRGHTFTRIGEGVPRSGPFDSILNDVPVSVNNVPVRFFGVHAYHCVNEGGDSGAPVIDSVTHSFVGIHFAGQPAQALSFLIPFTTIAARLNIRIAAV